MNVSILVIKYSGQLLCPSLFFCISIPSYLVLITTFFHNPEESSSSGTLSKSPQHHNQGGPHTSSSTKECSAKSLDSSDNFSEESSVKSPFSPTSLILTPIKSPNPPGHLNLIDSSSNSHSYLPSVLTVPSNEHVDLEEHESLKR